MFSSLLSFALVSLALPYAALASHGSANHRRHEAIAAAQHNITDAVETTLHRRGQTYNNARLTYYDVGLGACGKTNVPSDYIVALNSGMYGGGYPGPNCFRPISITYNGKTVGATIMDECPGCPSDGGLDLSEGLFAALAPLDDGVIYASWHFTDEGDDEPTTTTHKTSTHHSTSTTSWWQPPTTSWWQEETTSSTKSSTKHSSTHSSTSSTHSTSSTPSSTSTWSSTTSSSSSTSSTHSSTSTTSSAAAATTSAGPDQLEKLNQAFVGLSELMLAGAQAA
ncbi:hypothetical protein L226DRAFT_566440 [Lentinus tigrinus ALCF2SS1-7]|uniref:RlpA-like protein double-psi beta-barrel domain-containing protein n=1 Tax=Lentinus tigrinus ALCF2SS1-6 TaxID=1328759 RepID=A0A5C2SRG9_9APHY|nr:hypothetical protein L227DRAFT_606104 [Lentinus tigrinus ALCF2SS1-6]RPD79889.1 hypothetical protein L226DRAFT_566440 [Lentinus tigrinus ALCF2SS1-7]